MEVLDAKIVRCDHCGDTCPPHPPTHEGYHFCCEGCKSVYQLLASCDLSTYYELEQRPGITLRHTLLDDYEWLDEPGIVKSLIDYEDETQCRVRFILPQIHCSSCIWLLENLDRILPAVSESRVNFPQKSLLLVFDPHQASLREIVATLAQIGYPPELSSGTSETHTPKANTRLIRQLGIAGFCFGNIMLLSFPEYLGLEHEGFARLFGWLNIPLALLTLFFGASDYFKSALLGLRVGHINMDVPISIGITALAGQSFYEIIALAEAGYLDSLAGFIFFLLIGKWFQQKSLDSISFDRTYTSFFPLASRRVEDSGFQFVSISELNEGDCLHVRNGEIIPADAVLEGEKGEIDYSFVTGESRPVEVEEGEPLYAGGRVHGASIYVRLSKQVSNSYLTQLWENQEPSHQPTSFVQQLVDRTGKYFTLIILLTAFVGLAMWWKVSIPKAWFVFTSVLIIACPCAIALTVPFTLGNARRMLWKKGLITRSADSVLAMSQVDHIIFDKTGTLTHRGGTGLTWEGGYLSPAEKSWVASLVSQSAHPKSQAIETELARRGILPVNQFEELEGYGIQGQVEGHEIRLGSHSFLTGERVAGQGGTWIEMDGEIRGNWKESLHIREGILDLLEKLSGRYSLSLLSGDSPREAKVWRGLIGSYLSSLSFHQTPFEKLSAIQDLQQQGKKVLMVGDGLNDAGALKQSDVGIAITEDAGYFAPACDGIVQGKNLSNLDGYMSYAKQSVYLVYMGFILASAYNIVGLYFALNGWVTPVLAAILMPLSSLSLIAFAMTSTTLLSKKKYRKRSDISHPTS